MTYAPKPQRIVNRKLLDSYQGQPCAVLGPKSDVGGRESAYHWGGTAGHHVRHKGAMGDDVDENIIVLCAHHHVYDGGIHSDTVQRFIERWHIEPGALAKLNAYLRSRGKIE